MLYVMFFHVLPMRLLVIFFELGDIALATGPTAVLAVSGMLVPVLRIAPLALPIPLLASRTHALEVPVLP